jgi:hypothetical protein
LGIGLRTLVGAADISIGVNGQELASTLALQVRCGGHNRCNFRLYICFARFCGISFDSPIPNRGTNVQLSALDICNRHGARIIATLIKDRDLPLKFPS